MNNPLWPTTEGQAITSEYGWREHPIFGDWRFHAAIDITGNNYNHPIYATQTGVIIDKLNTSYGGYTVRIMHTGDEYYSQYQHMDAPSMLDVGDTVHKGQLIGYMGDTGDSTGIHLDFAIAITSNGFHTEEYTIDPLLYLDMEFDGEPDPPGRKKKSKFKPWLYTRKKVTIWRS